jgi:cation-transporting ATPase 13A1
LLEKDRRVVAETSVADSHPSYVTKMGIKMIALFKAVPVLWRLDALPFLLAHVVNLAMLVLKSSRPVTEGVVALGSNASETDAVHTSAVKHMTEVVVWGFSLPLLHTVLLAVLPILQLLTWLGTHWSVKFRAFVTMRRVTSVEEACHVLVVPAKPTEKIGMCKIEWVRLRSREKSTVETLPSFDFHKRRYLWEASERKWQKVAFPVRESMRFYANSRGLPDDASIADAAARWGLNSFEIPLPTYRELYAEQCRQPFFVFQVACVVLWSLDEYWYYSLFTLLMLLMFEGTVVLSRTRNLKMLREMMGAPTIVRVFRKGIWTPMYSHSLVPGDLISVNRNKNDPDQAVPADVLLLSGKVVVNEAILTGEATPQEKTSIACRDPNETLSLKRSDDTVRPSPSAAARAS